MKRLSYVIVSYNRRETLLRTLARLPAVTPLAPERWDIWVVDNCSTDGSADAVEANFPDVKLIRNSENQGVCARNLATERCTGQYVIPLDDDSYPEDAETVAALLSHLDENPEVGALVGRVVLPNGKFEAPALPSVFITCATCFRKAAMDRVGGFRPEFFRQAEEYDFSFRLWQSGFRVERREDIIFRHEKNAGSAGRDLAFVQRMDLRNNLIIAQRFLPGKLRQIYWDDWRLRYEALAWYEGNSHVIDQAVRSAMWFSWRELLLGKRTPLKSKELEQIFMFQKQATAVGDWSRRNSVWRVVIGDMGKNIWATYNACHASGLQIRSIADDTPAFAGLDYRGLPVLPVSRALLGGSVDGVVISNINPSQVEARYKAIRRHYSGPVLKLWESPRFATMVRPGLAA